MNMLYTSYYYEGHGGAEISLALTASAVEKLGHKIFVASSESYGKYNLKTLTFKKYAKIPVFRFHEAYLSKFLAKIIKENNIGIVHANDRLTSVPAVLAAKRCGIPVVVHFRDYWFACPKSTMLRRDMSMCNGCGLKELYKCSTPTRFAWDFYKMAYLERARKILREADISIVASNAVKEKLLKFGFDNVAVVKNPVVLNKAENSSEQKTKFGLKNNVITYIGTLDYSKGITKLLDVAINVLKQNTGTSFLIVGAGKIENILRKKINAGGMQDRIIIAGGLPHSEMPEIYAASDIIAVPSLWDEPFGRVAVEAMAAGKPVLASNAGGLKDIIKDEWCKITVFDSAAWQEKLAALINDKSARKKLGKENEKLAKEYAPEKIAREIIKIYESILQNDKLQQNSKI